MFIGSFKYSIDAKNRVAIPAKLRKSLKSEDNDTFVMTRNTTARCITLYPLSQWKELVDKKLANLNEFNQRDAMFIRLFMQPANEDSMDTQARLTITPDLLNYAGIEKEVFILGAFKTIEIWNPKNYEEYINKQTVTYEEISEDVMRS